MFFKFCAVMLICLVVGIVVAACSSDGTETPTKTSPPTASVIPMATRAPPPCAHSLARGGDGYVNGDTNKAHIRNLYDWTPLERGNQ